MARLTNRQKDQKADLDAIEKEIGLLDLWYFLVHILKMPLVARVHKPLVTALEKGDWYELLVLWARGFFKTSIVAGYVAWCIAKNRNFTGLAVASDQDVYGNSLVALVQKHLENKRVVRLYGAFRSPDLTWSRSGFEVLGRTDTIRDLTFRAVGRENFKPGGHFDLVWFDDVENDETAGSIPERERTRKIDQDAYSMADKPGARRVTTGTYWANDDIYIEKEVGFGFYEVPADGSEPERKNAVHSPDGMAFYLYQPFFGEDGDPIFPERYDRKFIEFRRSKLQPFHFAAQYLLSPRARADRRWNPEDFEYVSAVPTEGDDWIGVDLARSRKQESDRCGFVHMRSHDFKYYVLQVEILQLDGDQLLEKFFEIHALRPKARFAIEEDGYGAGIHGRLDDWMRKRRTYFTITWINAHSRDNKASRSLATLDLFKTHSILFTRNTGCEQLQGQYLAFDPNNKRAKDDGIDALTNVVETVKQSPEAPKKKKRWKYAWWSIDENEMPWENSPNENNPYLGGKITEVPCKAL